MDRAAALAAKERADLVLSTDPDADRLGAMAPDAAGQWRFVTGNEFGVLDKVVGRQRRKMNLGHSLLPLLIFHSLDTPTCLFEYAARLDAAPVVKIVNSSLDVLVQPFPHCHQSKTFGDDFFLVAESAVGNEFLHDGTVIARNLNTHSGFPHDATQLGQYRTFLNVTIIGQN